MTEMLSESEWLRESKSHLVQLREELCLTEVEMTIVDRGIAALETLLAITATTSR
jgi:hypothetical protein